MPTDEGRRLAELRRSGASGPHGKKTPDRYNAEREAAEQAEKDDEGDEEWLWS